MAACKDKIRLIIFNKGLFKNKKNEHFLNFYNFFNYTQSLLRNYLSDFICVIFMYRQKN